MPHNHDYSSNGPLPIDPDGFAELMEPWEVGEIPAVAPRPGNATQNVPSRRIDDAQQAKMPESAVYSPPPSAAVLRQRARLEKIDRHEAGEVVGHSGRRGSHVFQPGQQVTDSLLTVLGPGFKNRWGAETWQLVKCRCRCGREVEVPYHYLYVTPPKYSCGCARRVSKDWSGYAFYSPTSGRTLTILYLNDENLWVYVCDCCAGLGTVGRGGGVQKELKAAAVRKCPNHREYIPIESFPHTNYSGSAIEVEYERRAKNYPAGQVVRDPKTGWVKGIWILGGERL